MRFFSFLLPFLSLGAGISGYYIRSIELATVFDPVTGLAQRDAFISMVLIGVSCFVFLVTIIFSIRASIRYTVAADYDNAFGTDSFTYPAIYTAIGTVWLVATLVYFFGYYVMGDDDLIIRIFSISSASAAIFLIIFSLEVYKNPRRKFLSFLSVIPTLFMCLWLILVYRDNASNPVLFSYAYKILAIVFAAMGCYFSSSFAIGKPVIGKAIVSYVGAIYFCVLTLADDYPMSMKFILSAIAFMSIFNLASLLWNLQKKSWIRKYRIQKTG